MLKLKKIMKLSFNMYSFFLLADFIFYSRRVLPFVHFIYYLPCYSWLSIFNRISYLIDLIYNILFFVNVSSLCAFLSFCALEYAGFLLSHKDAVFTLYRFSLLHMFPMEFYVCLFVCLLCILLLLPRDHWWCFRILYLEFVSQIFPEEYGIYFLELPSFYC